MNYKERINGISLCSYLINYKLYYKSSNNLSISSNKPD